MKRIETKRLEKALLLSCFGANPRLAKEYGTTEVTIDFQRNGNGRDNAKKSWYGNYNYLVLSKTLYLEQSLEDWKMNIPSHVGILVVNPDSLSKKTVRKAAFMEISEKDKDMLKRSLIRTLFYQNQKNDWDLRNQAEKM